MFDKMFSGITPIQKGLDASSLQLQVIQQNIANVETPNYKRQSVVFSEYYQQALNGGLRSKQTNSRHMPFSNVDNIQATVVTDYNTTMKMDGNNVDPEFENAELAKAQIYYSTLVEKMNSEFARLRSAIRGGS